MTKQVGIAGSSVAMNSAIDDDVHEPSATRRWTPKFGAVSMNVVQPSRRVLMIQTWSAARTQAGQLGAATLPVSRDSRPIAVDAPRNAVLCPESVSAGVSFAVARSRPKTAFVVLSGA